MVAYDEMLRQHQSVLADVDRLELLLGSPPSDLSPERLRELTLNDARALAQDLARHFAYEEDGGYLRVVLDARPGLARPVEDLLAQHREIAARLREALAGAEDAPIETVRGRIRSALMLLREHEAAETKLVHEVVIRDVGTPD